MTVAVINVSDTEVGVAWLEQGKIAFSSRRRLPAALKFDYDYFGINLERALKEELHEWQRAARRAPQQIICFVPPLFYATRVSQLKSRPHRPFKVSRRMIDNIAERELSQLREYGERVIGYEVTGVKINGYPVKLSELAAGKTDKKTLDRKVDELDLSLLTVLGSTPALDYLQQVISGVFHQDQITFYPAVLPWLAALKPKLQKHSAGILIDWLGELTEVSLIEHGQLVASASFPLGLNWLLRHLAKAQQTNIPEALSALELYLATKHHPTANDRLKRVLELARQEWQKNLNQILSKMLEHYSLPKNFWLIGDNNLTPLLATWLARRDFGHFPTTNHETWRFDILTAGDLSLKIGGQSDLSTVDLPLLVEASFYCGKIISK